MRTLTAAVVAALLPSLALAQGRELGLTLDMPVRDLAASAQLRLPPEGRPARCAIVMVNWPMSRGVFESPRWRQSADTLDCAMLLATFEGPAESLPPDRQPQRNAAVGGAAAVHALLERVAVRVHRPELRTVPLMFWGFSASGSFGISFAALHPERTIGVITFHSHRRGLPIDDERIKEIPHLLIAGGEDETAGTEDARQMWTAGRKRGSPWTFVIQPGKNHGEGLGEVTDLMLSWMAAVVSLRTGGRAALAAIDSGAGWYGDHRILGIAPGVPEPGDEVHTSWLPDEGTARLWHLAMRTPR